jgi:hypothetical protein
LRVYLFFRNATMSLENTHSNVLIRSPVDEVHQMVPCTPNHLGGKMPIESGYGNFDFIRGQVSDDDSGDYFVDGEMGIGGVDGLCPLEQPPNATRKSTRRRAKPRVDDQDGYMFGGSDEDVVSGEIQLVHVAESQEGISALNHKGSGKTRRATKAAKARLQDRRSLQDATAVIPQNQLQNTRKSARKTARTPITKKMRRGGSSIRKPQLAWVKGKVSDPRTGEEFTTGNVPPGEFCTQCSATTTPVWRAGPFGHKTLCNACGVRWMKVTPKRR